MEILFTQVLILFSYVHVRYIYIGKWIQLAKSLWFRQAESAFKSAHSKVSGKGSGSNELKGYKPKSLLMTAILPTQYLIFHH